jgi:hypothetical protein
MITILNSNTFHTQVGPNVKDNTNIEFIANRVNSNKSIRVLSKNTYKNMESFVPIESITKLDELPRGRVLRLKFTNNLNQIKEIVCMDTNQIYTIRGFVRASSIYVSNVVVDDAGRLNKLVSAEYLSASDVTSIHQVDLTYNHNIFVNGLLMR